MPDPLAMAGLAAAALLGFTIAGISGFGGGLIVMPLLVWMLGPREAVPIIGLVQLAASASRMTFNLKGIS